MIYYLVPETITNPAVRSQSVSIALALQSGMRTSVSYWGFMKDDPSLRNQTEKIRQELDQAGIDTRLFIIERDKGFWAVLQLLFLIAFRLRKKIKIHPGRVLVRNLFGAQLAYFATLGMKNASYTVDLRGHTGAEWEMTGVMRVGSFKAKLFYLWESFLLKNASSVLCVSQVLAEYVKKTTKCKTPCFIIPSCLDRMLEKELEMPELQDSRESPPADQVTLAYAGTITGWNRVDTMIVFFERLRRLIPNVKFLCITTHVEEAEKCFKSLHVTSSGYTILRVPHEDIISTLRKADVGLLLREKSMVNQVASPVKAAEYMAAGLAVITTEGVGDLSDLVREKQLGLVLDSLDPEAWDNESLLDFFENLLSDREAYKTRLVTFAKVFFVRDNYLPIYREALGVES
jgi:glycosyltransferase involved in cell wall biosynthesis